MKHPTYNIGSFEGQTLFNPLLPSSEKRKKKLLQNSIAFCRPSARIIISLGRHNHYNDVLSQLYM